MLSLILNTLSHLIFFRHKITQKTWWGKNTNQKKMSNTDLTNDFTKDILLCKSKAYVIVVWLTN